MGLLRKVIGFPSKSEMRRLIPLSCLCIKYGAGARR